jgi:undecaprenyl-diphosphatase
VVAWFGSIKRRSVASIDEKVGWALVLGTVPGAVAGAVGEDIIQRKLGQPWIIAVMLTVFAAVLYLVDKLAKVDRSFDSIRPRTGLGLGFAQALALQPGVSRSGVTITAGRLIGLDRGSAARISFLLSLPIIAGAGMMKGLDIAQNPSMLEGMGAQFVVGIIASAVSGFLVIAFLLSYLRKHNFGIFLWYRVGVTMLVFALMAAGIRPATA